jgi:hypothetical protein
MQDAGCQRLARQARHNFRNLYCAQKHEGEPTASMLHTAHSERAAMDRMGAKARHLAIAVCGGLAGAMATPVLADDSAREGGQTGHYPYVTGGISAEFYVDAVFDADNRDVRGTDAYSSRKLI